MTITLAPATVHLRPWHAADIDRLGQAATAFSRAALARRFGAPHTAIPDWYLAQISEGWARGTWNASVAESAGRIVGWAEYGLNSDPRHADLAALVSDGYQGAGLGTRLVREVASLAGAAGVRVLYAQIQAGNHAACRALHAALPEVRCAGLQDGEWHYVIGLPTRHQLRTK